MTGRAGPRRLDGGGLARLVGSCLAALGLSLALLLALAAPASAHVRVEMASPQDGSRLTEPPDRIDLYFSEPVDPRTVVVLLRGHATGPVETAPVDDGLARLGQELSVRTPEGLPDDSYAVTVTVAGLDGHSISQVFDFVVGDGPLVVTGAGARVEWSQASTPLFLVSQTAKLLETTGLALLGMMFTLLLAWRGGLAEAANRRLVRWGLSASLAAAALGVLAFTANAAGVPVGRAASASLLAETMATPYGRLMGLRCVAILAITVVLLRLRHGSGGQRPGAGTANAAVVGGTVMLLTIAAASHAATDQWAFLVLLASMVHTGAIALWLGALVLLLLQAVRGRLAQVPVLVVARCTRVATWCVPVALSSGLFLSWRLTDGFEGGVVGGAYGAVLAVKVVLVGLLLAQAVSTQASLRPTCPGPDPDRAPSARRALAVEAVVGLLVLAAAGALSTVPTG